MKKSLAPTKPRLRFDKVAQRFVAQVQAALHDDVADGKTVIFTVTAPIRQASKTATELEEHIRAMLSRASTKSEIALTINDNHIRVRAVTGGKRDGSRLIGFVHNPEPHAAQILLDAAQSEMQLSS